MQTRLNQFFQVPQSSIDRRKRKETRETVFSAPSTSFGDLPAPEAQKRVKLSKPGRLSDDYKQQVIDVGQAKFGTQRCLECEMCYSIHSETDKQLHEEYHNRFKAQPVVKVTQAQIDSWKKKAFFVDIPNGFIFRILGDSNVKTLKQKFDSFVETTVNDELGYTRDLSLWPKSGERVGWMYVKKEYSRSFIAGVLITDMVEEAQFYYSKGVKKGTFLGVNRIWTHRSTRRRGIARLLLDEARKSLPFLHSVVPKYDVAFSEPSADGIKLARGYCSSQEALQASEDFLTYDI
ncbi:hypothetical protein L596_022115 [Steinernema carpocapsae]|uniref:N-acetyltransferase domain-containing protein n=1 Tax=Steinernema carpocapsae TaxID=34508 RepID=A0A4V6A043_STECR|nr:hypothetical protein L596_022115 [Steinernema carpocapsae]